MKLPEQFFHAIAFVDDLMRQLNVRYALVGSVAEYLYGCERDIYRDLDLVADLNDTHIEPLCQGLKTTPEYLLPSRLDHLWEYLSDEVIDAQRARCICQADYICFTYGTRADFRDRVNCHAFIAHDYAYRLLVLENAQRRVICERPYVVASVPPLDDLIVCSYVYGIPENKVVCDKDKLFTMYADQLDTQSLHQRIDYYRRELARQRIYEQGGVRDVTCRYQNTG